MNADTIPDDPLARDILKALVDSRAGYNYYDDTRLLLPIIERHTADHIATLEARIAEQQRELGAMAAALKEAVATNEELRADLDGANAAFRRQVAGHATTATQLAAARAERDEAVGLLERRHGMECPTYDDSTGTCGGCEVKALLVRLAAAPEKETTP